MRTSKTFSIKFWAHLKKAKNNNALLYARVTVDQKRLSISLKRTVPIDLWDRKKQHIIGNSAEARQTNLYLEQIRNKVFSIYQELKYHGQQITAELIKFRYMGEDETSHSLQELIAYHSEKIEKTLAAGTIRNFGITENYINRFLTKKLKASDIYLKELNYKFICDFEIFLSCYYPKGHPKAMSHNTVMKHIQRLRKMVTIAYHLEWPEKDPFLRWKPTFEKKEREFLTSHELSNLETYELSIKRLDRVRDLFLFSCYTGISYIDIM